MARESYAIQSLGSAYGKVKKARVLMVGAGGIGCELLKNLVLSGFGEVHVVDLDTIDLSNLNRQFLFGFEHIKKPKALVARETASRFNPAVHIEAYHANIKDAKFNLTWFKTFDIVFNALDNIDARRHVNKMCIAADVPLIDAGTTGFNGHVAVIKKGVTKCYDCVPPVPPKSFPVCTIRNTPSEPIHCIVWAKSYLFPELFGISEETAAEVDWDAENAENSREDIEKLRKEAAELRDIRASMGSNDFPRKIFDKVFRADIEAMSLEGEVWKQRKPPKPLSFDPVSKEAETIGREIVHNDHTLWSVAESYTVFKDSLERLSAEMKRLKLSSTAEEGSEPVLEFDKDDQDTLDFVAAAANLRSHIFGVEIKSKFDIKQIAGNIIPAIATTNAMIGGLTVLAAFKVLRDEVANAKLVHLQPNHTERVFAAENTFQPNPYCPVCASAYTAVKLNMEKATLRNLVDQLKSTLNYDDEIAISLDGRGLLYDIDEDVNLPKTLQELGVSDAAFLTVTDESDEPLVDLKLVVEVQSPDAEEPISIAKLETTLPRKQIEKAAITIPSNDVASNGQNGAANGNLSDLKRKRSPEGLDGPVTHKKGKIDSKAEEETIVLDDDDDGAIVLD